MSINKTNKYHAYLIPVDRDVANEIKVGDYQKLSTALVHARVAATEQGADEWDWVVDKVSPSGEVINRRSSVGGFEPIKG